MEGTNMEHPSDVAFEVVERPDMFDNIGKFTHERDILFVRMLPVLKSKVWLTWSEDDQDELREVIRKTYQMYSKFARPLFDTVIWRGHESGEVRESLKPVKDAPNFTKTPGRKAKSAEDVLDSI